MSTDGGGSSVMKPHEVLGVSEGATMTEIKRAWRARLLEVHPDVGGTADATQKVQLAYEELCAGADVVRPPTVEPTPRTPPRRPARPASDEDIQRLIRDLDDEIAKNDRWMERMLKQEQQHRRMMARKQCIATTKKGNPCQSWPKGDGLYCAVHEPNATGAGSRSARPVAAETSATSSGGYEWRATLVMVGLASLVLFLMNREVAVDTLPVVLLILSPLLGMALLERARSKVASTRPVRSQDDQ